MGASRARRKGAISSFTFCVVVGSILPTIVVIQGCEKTTNSGDGANPCASEAGLSGEGGASRGAFYAGDAQATGSFDDGRCVCQAVDGGTYCFASAPSEGGTSEGGTSEGGTSESGATDAPADSAGTCPAGGAYSCSATNYTDPAGHKPFIGDVFPMSLTLTASGTNLAVKGTAPFVDVAGTCPGTLTGSGTVAGNANVSCKMYQIVVTATGFTAVYEMGANGELPGGLPMIVDVSCTR